MNIKKVLPVVLMASASSLLGANSYAEDSYYVGVEFGTADHDTNTEITSGAGSISDSGSASKLFLGYRVTPSFAVELQYADLGESSLSFTDGSTINLNGTSGTAGAGQGGSADSEISSVGLSGVYRFNAEGSVKPFVKLGLHRWSADSTTTSSLLSNGSTSGTDIFYGVGVDFSIADQWGLTVSYDSYDIDHNQESTDQVSTLGVGVNYTF